MKLLQDEYWELRYEEEVWTNSKTDDSRFVGTFENHDYPNNSSLAQYVVNMHNTQLDAANIQPFCYDTLMAELRGSEA